MTEKVRENRLRRMAKRQGYQLIKSHLHDQRAIGFGCYELTRVENNTSVFGLGPTGQPKATLDDVEEFLTDLKSAASLINEEALEIMKSMSLENPDVSKTIAAMIERGVPREEAENEITRTFLGCMWEVNKGINNRLSEVLGALREGRTATELFPDGLYETERETANAM